MQPKQVKTVVYHLSMARPPHLTRAGRPCPAPDGVQLVHIPRPPLHFYRYIYRAVGRPHKWVSRENLDDAALASIIHHPQIAIHVLYWQGVPAGFIELDWRKSQWRKTGEITFLGLMPEYIGNGLGRFLLRRAIALAWAKPIRSLLIETCTLDHPRALRLYLDEGFTAYCRREETITLPPDWEQRTPENAAKLVG